MASISNISNSTSKEVLKGKKPIGHLISLPDESPVEVTVNLWVRPPEGETKLNVDGSFMASDGKAGAGMIPRAHDGTIIFSACRSLEQCNSALEAELCAIMEGTALAVERCQQPIMIETDSAEVVRMLTTTARDRSPLGHIVAKARTLINSERVAGIVKIPRSQNVASHLLAGYSRLNGHTDVWLGIGPEPILDALLRDCNTSLYA
jgi:ribonuclease HI